MGDSRLTHLLMTHIDEEELNEIRPRIPHRIRTENVLVNRAPSYHHHRQKLTNIKPIEKQ